MNKENLNAFLKTCGIDVSHLQHDTSPQQIWLQLIKENKFLNLPFKQQEAIFSQLYPDWQDNPSDAVAWKPTTEFCQQTNLWQMMTDLSIKDVKTFHQWSALNRFLYWEIMIKKLQIVFQTPYNTIADAQSPTHVSWLPGASLNIADSCFTANANKCALIYLDQHKHLQRLSYGELNNLSNQIANGLLNVGLKPKDTIAIVMPMTVTAIAIYLGIIKMGGTVVSIPDSFSSDEIGERLAITQCQHVFTQDSLSRGGKTLPLYEKFLTLPCSVILFSDENTSVQRKQDIPWVDFLSDQRTFDVYHTDAMSPCNILFSSGTTGIPKAIPWVHATGIKAAADAFLHHDIKPHDVLCWPTNLGWMMGPWLIFAALINQASIAVYEDIPTTPAFGKFIQDSKTTMLGVVPTIVANWKQQQIMQGLDWSNLKCFSSTGECSNAEDMLYLMSLAHYKPIIEYCGGTEIGGAYISSTLLEDNCPSIFTTPTMGLDFVLLDETGHLTDNGEVGIIPPSIGLSNTLLNADNEKTYFAGMPEHEGIRLRRHGDQLLRYSNGRYTVLGRIDDTMNLSGIKVSAAEIERALVGIEDIAETAAIAVNLNHSGPSSLVIYAVTATSADKKHEMQQRINAHLNPLFKIYEVVYVDALPKTASNKIMRRKLRQEFETQFKAVSKSS